MKTLSLLLFLGGMLLCGADFFAPAPDAGANLPADKVYPSGRVFPVSGYSASSAQLIRKFGFTVAGPVYGGNQAMSKWAEQAKAAGLPILWQLTVEYEGKPVTLGMLEKFRKEKKPLDWDAVAQSTRETVKAALDKFGDSIL